MLLGDKLLVRVGKIILKAVNEYIEEFCINAFYSKMGL